MLYILTLLKTDKISFSLLLSKLGMVGIHGAYLRRWLTCYLRDRTQAVAIKGDRDARVGMPDLLYMLYK